MKRTLATIFKYLFLIVAALLSVFPLYWMAVSATNESAVVLGGAMLPGANLVQNYRALLASQDLMLAMKNSFVTATLQTVLALAICSLAGYGFEIYHDKAKDRVMSTLLLAMMVPMAATLIPLFRMFSQMKLLNTYTAFILPGISTPFLIMMFRQNARAFPHDIIEAARIDGLSEVAIFLRMFIPTMKSTYAAAMTITFMNAWNSYLWPKVVMQGNEAITMPMLIANLIAGYVTDYGALMLGVLLCTLPTVVIFFALQKFFTEGIAGSVK
ncbi:carbohydrate ABC transporter permease [Bacillota bacterium Meth-B3]|nr:carbohydrate ABC transporter permease [Christensenellaceae bacterium]MEA5065018.1 carbohydrate ABC transporter permease [Eubacteriales bacterium]MEA5070225.1 carbohydrate ABC transporter permease [Christensenellaceae bacterium]